jgi:hypothetical protein
MTMNKKTFIAAKIIISLVLVLLVVLACVVEVAIAGPTVNVGDVPPDASTKPSNIEIISPQNNTVFGPNSFFVFSVNVYLPESITATQTYINSIDFKPDWEQNSTLLYDSQTINATNRIESGSLNAPKYFSYIKELTGIPDGNHSITVYVSSGGIYTYPSGTFGYSNGYTTFTIMSNATIFFTVHNNNSLVPSPTPSQPPSSSPTQQPTSTQTAEPFPKPIFSTPTPTVEPFSTTLVMTVVIVVVIATIVLVVLIIVGLLRYIVKSKKQKD